MMSDIFTSFDPDANYMYASYPKSFWIITSAALVMMQASFWAVPTRMFWLTHAPLKFMYNQTHSHLTSKLKAFPAIITALFMLLITSNLLGLLPYVFSTSSHLVMTLALSFPLWLSIILSSAAKNLPNFLASLLPPGAPAGLNPFLVLIETISNILRPNTLALRLTANITMGHVVLTLISAYVTSVIFTSLVACLSGLLLSILYTLIEMGIGLMQAYIFCLLLMLYSDEHMNC